MKNQFLRDYVNTVKWDLDKIIDIAEKVEDKRKKTLTQHDSTPIPSTSTLIINISKENNELDNSSRIAYPAEEEYTRRLPQAPQGPIPITPVAATPSIVQKNDFHSQHTASAANCAIPIAMILTSSIDFIGSLLNNKNQGINLWKAGNKFEVAIKYFFQYVNEEHIDEATSSEFLDAYQAIYRNGYMHSFFPQGENVAINYDSSFSDKEWIFLHNDNIELNVYKLKQIVYTVFDKILTDCNIQETIHTNFNSYKDFLATDKKVQGAIQNFKTSHQ